MLFPIPHAQVRKLYQVGDIVAARKASQRAEYYSVAAFRIGCNGILMLIALGALVLLILYIIVSSDD